MRKIIWIDLKSSRFVIVFISKTHVILFLKIKFHKKKKKIDRIMVTSVKRKKKSQEKEQKSKIIKVDPIERLRKLISANYFVTFDNCSTGELISVQKFIQETHLVHLQHLHYNKKLPTNLVLVHQELCE